MKTSRKMLWAALIALSAATAYAQPGNGQGPAAGSGTGAGGGAGPMGVGAAARWGAADTPGWSLMTRQERLVHRDRMRAAKTYETCTAYQAQHHEEMVARAKTRGQTLASPQRDACAGLKP
jgi:hypothetical protein